MCVCQIQAGTGHTELNKNSSCLSDITALDCREHTSEVEDNVTSNWRCAKDSGISNEDPLAVRVFNWAIRDSCISHDFIGVGAKYGHKNYHKALCMMGFLRS